MHMEKTTIEQLCQEYWQSVVEAARSGFCQEQAFLESPRICYLPDYHGSYLEAYTPAGKLDPTTTTWIDLDLSL